jgi:putative tryptophan/tyrosine transport system substrate-binding protein
MSDPTPRSNHAHGLVMALALVWGSMSSFGQAPTNRVVVVNSDAAIGKYTAAQKAFEGSLDVPVTTINLAGMSDRAAQRAVRAASPSAVYAIGSRAYSVSQASVHRKPVVMSSVINWRRLSGAESKDTHVIANELPSEMQLTLFRYFFPDIKRIGVLYSTRYNRQWMKDTKATAKELGIEVIGESVRSTSRVKSEVTKLLPKVDALWITSDPTVLGNEEALRNLFTAAAAAQKPVFTYTSAFAPLGPTLIIQPDLPTIGRQAARILLDHRSGAHKEIQSPAGSEVTLNLRTVTQYRLNLYEDAMDSVNHIIR